VRLRNNDSTREEILTRYFPQYRLIAPQAHSGLGGASCIIEQGERRLVLRQHHDPYAPASHFRRQFRALRRLPWISCLPLVFSDRAGWPSTIWKGSEKRAAGHAELAAMLYHLHRQPRLGWRITFRCLNTTGSRPRLTDVLQCGWHISSGCVKRASRSRFGSPLHMDVHAGNIVHTPAGIRLIDWEYAGDGDVALELAAVWTESEAARQTLIRDYARVAHIDADALRRQVKRWRPWVVMLMAGWFEMRYQQSRDKQFIALADDAWRQLQTKG
jgi:thiamine kinase